MDGESRAPLPQTDPLGFLPHGHLEFLESVGERNLLGVDADEEVIDDRDVGHFEHRVPDPLEAARIASSFLDEVAVVLEILDPPGAHDAGEGVLHPMTVDDRLRAITLDEEIELHEGSTPAPIAMPSSNSGRLMSRMKASWRDLPISAGMSRALRRVTVLPVRCTSFHVSMGILLIT